MKIYKIYGEISSFWDGSSWDYSSDLYKTKRRAEKDIPNLKNTYSRREGYDSKFEVYSVKVIE